jgi:nucleotide-binding universal stress UspA family protein
VTRGKASTLHRVPLTDTENCVVVGIDGRERGWDALTWACAHASRINSTLIVVFVAPRALWGPMDVPIVNDLESLLDGSELAELARERVEGIARDMSVALYFEHAQGNLGRIATTIGRNRYASLVVLSARPSRTRRLLAAISRRRATTRPMMLSLP